MLTLSLELINRETIAFISKSIGFLCETEKKTAEIVCFTHFISAVFLFSFYENEKKILPLAWSVL